MQHASPKSPSLLVIKKGDEGNCSVALNLPFEVRRLLLLFARMLNYYSVSLL